MDMRTPNPSLYNLAYRIADFHEMPYRKLGATGLKVSNIGLGTWKMGYPETGDGARTDEKASLALLDAAWEQGVTFWDTANRYNNASGNSERIIGTWFANHPEKRRDIVLCTKLCGSIDGMTPNHSGLSRANVLESLYASLDRMGIDYVDVLYFHAFDFDTDPEESLMAVEDLIRQDLVRYFAVSNFTAAQLRMYEDAMKSVSPRCKIVAVQNRYNIINGEFVDEKVLPYCVEKKISYTPHSPLAQGLISDRYLKPYGKGDRLVDDGLTERLTEDVLAKLRGLKEIADSLSLSVTQLAIAYMLSMEGMGPIIAACSNLAQLQENAAAGKVVLTPETIAAVKAIVG